MSRKDAEQSRHTPVAARSAAEPTDRPTDRADAAPTPTTEDPSALRAGVHASIRSVLRETYKSVSDADLDEIVARTGSLPVARYVVQELVSKHGPRDDYRRLLTQALIDEAQHAS